MCEPLGGFPYYSPAEVFVKVVKRGTAMNTRTAGLVVARMAVLTIFLFILSAIDFWGLRLDKSVLIAPLPHVLMCLLDVIVISYPIIRSSWTGCRLVATIFFVFYGVMTFLTQIETVVFLQYFKDVVPVEETPKLFLNGAIIAAIFAPLAVWIHGKMRSAERMEQATVRLTMPLPRWIWRVTLIGVIYVVIYFVFGAFVAMPIGGQAFQQLYGGLQMPVWFLPFQIVRGVIFALLAIPIIRMMRGPLWEAGLAVALLFSVLMVGLLLAPNEYMADQVRMAHIVEVSCSNFLFGWIVVWILGRRHRSQPSKPQ